MNPILPFDDPVGMTPDAGAHTRARTEDPVTSHQAADAITPELRELQQRVLTLFTECGPMTHHQLIASYRFVHGATAESTIRTRCAELVDMGLLRDTGETRPIGRRQAIVWAVK